MSRMVHDEDVEVYVNGVLSTREGGFTTSFGDYELSAPKLASLRVGANTVAVHCHYTTGGQSVDMGVVDVPKNR